MHLGCVARRSPVVTRYALCALCLEAGNSEVESGLRTYEESNCRRIFFLAKPQRSQRRSMNDLVATFHDSSRLMLAVARVVRNYALRVHSDPLAGRGPCGRPPWQDNQFPIRGADGHKGRALQMAGTTLERPKVSLRALILRDNNSAAQ